MCFCLKENNLCAEGINADNLTLIYVYLSYGGQNTFTKRWEIHFFIVILHAKF